MLLLSRRKSFLFKLIISMITVVFAFRLILQRGQALAVTKFFMAIPETIGAVSDSKVSVSETKRNDAEYWERKLYDLYDVPDPFSSLVGPDNVTFKDKYIIYRCDPYTMKPCGGWGDRVKSMLTVYLLANMTGRVFKAENIMPDCDIRRFMAPNHVNWSLPVSFHKKVSSRGRVAVFDMYVNTKLYAQFSKVDWLHHPTLAADFVYIKGNHDNADNFREYSLYPESLRWMHSQDRVSINRVLFKRLFRPSDYLRKKLIHFLAENVKSDEKLICAHLRMGKNPTMPEDFRNSIKEIHLAKVWELIRNMNTQYGNKTKIFLMSDSHSAIAQGQKQDFKDKVFFSPGKIVHVELNKKVTSKQRCEGFEKIVFEQQVLLHCDNLIVTDSGLSRMAAYVRGRDELHCLLKDGRLLPCRPIDLKTKRFYDTIN